MRLQGELCRYCYHTLDVVYLCRLTIRRTVFAPEPGLEERTDQALCLHYDLLHFDHLRAGNRCIWLNSSECGLFL